MPDAMISVEKLVKSHGGQRVLDGIDLAVNAGEVAVVIGPSGGGKSTLLRCINGLESFQAGSVRVEDHRLESGSLGNSSSAKMLDLRRTIGMVFQQFHLFPHMNVLQNVALAPRRVLGWQRTKAEDQGKNLLDRVGLSKKVYSRPNELSGGEQQRVAIARALAVQPRAILFDEPTSSLDPRMAAEVLAVIADLARDGLTMIVVTHAMGFARQVAHTVHVMDAGRMAESGPPNQIFGDPQTEVTRQFLSETAHVVLNSPPSEGGE